jgi:pimeloyl-ACP methyl ester carboxylesterase
LAGIQQIHYRRRGYGQSTAVGGPPESFMARAAADAAQLLAHLGVGPAHVVGHSSGALVALDLACDTPRAVRSLALLEPPLLGVPSTGPHMAALTSAVERYAAGDPAGGIDGLFSLVFGPGWRPAPIAPFLAGLSRRKRMPPRSSNSSCLASERGSSIRVEPHRSRNLCSS